MRLILSIVLLCSISFNSYAQQTLTIGVVPQFQVKKLHRIWQPILASLEQETGYKFIFRGSPDIPSFEKAFLAGQFDLAYMNPYHYLIAEDIYTPLVRDVGRKLYGIVVVAKDSAYSSLSDLDNELLVLPAPNALGASLMTRAAMTNEFKINYQTKYVNTHSSVYLNVALGKAAAGGGVQKTLARQPENIRNRLKVIYNTEKVAPHPIVVNKKISTTVTTKIKQALLKIASTAKGAEMLSKVPFKQLGKATPADYEPLRGMQLDMFFKKHEIAQ